MAKQNWAVRVVFFLNAPLPIRGDVTTGPERQLQLQQVRESARAHAKFDLLGSLLEQLRYAGLARELAHFDHGKPTERKVFEFYAPKGVTETLEWANLNAKRMETFGYNAVAAPAWGQQPTASKAAEAQGMGV